MEHSNLETIRQLLHLTSAAQLLFDGEVLVAASDRARRLFPTAQEGVAAETLLGPAVEQYRSFSGGCLLFPVDAPPCDVTVADCQGYRLLTAVEEDHPWEQAAMQAVADGIRAPLTSVLALTPKLLPLLEQTPHVLDHAAELNRSLYAILRVTGNLQLCSRPEPTLHLSQIDLGTWLQSLVGRIAPVYGPLTYQGPSERIPCSLDCDQMERALLNLISNAIKFSQPQGPVMVQLRKRGRRAWITVEDRGCGIPPDQMDTVFSRSEHRGQLPDPRWGVGLGLPIVKRIVKAHEGQLLLESQEGIGTKVHIALKLRTGGDLVMRSHVRLPDYSGGIDHTLVELADVLPASAFDSRGVDL